MADDQDLNSETSKAADLIKKLEEISKTLDSTKDSTKAASAGTRNLVNELASSFGIISEKLEDGKGSLESYKRINKELLNIKKKQVKLDIRRAVLLEQARYATGRRLQTIQEELEAIYDTNETLKAGLSLTEGMSEQFKEMKKNSDFFVKLAKSFNSIPGLGPLLAQPLERAAEAAAQGGKLAGSLTLLKEVGALFSAATVAKSILEASKQAKELSNSLGVGLTAANGIQKEFTEFANQTGDARLTTQGLVEAQIKLQQNLKLGTQFSGETLQNFIQLTEYLGVSEKAASRIALVQESIGDKSGEFANNLAESAVLSARNLGVNLPLQEVYESIGNLSTTTLINLRRNPEALGQALAEAKKLGIELDSIRGISESLLNFEQSIQSELEAEVLTGRQLNLERARAAALRGDDVALAQELSKQVGTISEFENMNVIARQSLAKSFGLNVDQMGDMLLKQEAIKANEEAAANLTAAQLRDARERVDATTSLGQALKEVATEADATKNFENAAKQLQQAFQQIVLEVTPLVTSISKLLANLLASPFGKLAVGLAGGAALVMKALSTFRPTGLTPATAMYTKEVGSGSGLGMGTFYNKGKFYKGGQFLPGGGRARAGGQFIGGGLTKAGKIGVGVGAASAGMLLGGALTKAAESASTDGAAIGLSTAGGALSAAGTGAMIGAIGGPIGMAVGGGIGAIVGGITSYMDAAEKRREEADRKRQEEFQNAMRDVAMREAKIYMDKHEVGRSTANATAI